MTKTDFAIARQDVLQALQDGLKVEDGVEFRCIKGREDSWTFKVVKGQEEIILFHMNYSKDVRSIFGKSTLEYIFMGLPHFSNKPVIHLKIGYRQWVTNETDANLQDACARIALKDFADENEFMIADKVFRVSTEFKMQRDTDTLISQNWFLERSARIRVNKLNP
jgi:hypothetical protein